MNQSKSGRKAAEADHEGLLPKSPRRSQVGGPALLGNALQMCLPAADIILQPPAPFFRESMKATLNKLKGAAKPPIHRVIRTIFRMDPGYEFKPAPSIKQQSIDFEFKQHRLSVTSDHTTPLYDTVAEIAEHDCYQLDQIDFANSAEGLVLDVGAQIGIASVVLSRLHRGKILCIEPVPENCRFLQKNLEANQVTNAVIVPAALMGQDGFAEFEIDPNSSVAGRAAGLMATDPRVFTQTLRVKAVTLRTALRDFPSQAVHLIKMDCEGGEYSIVDQITPELQPRIRNMTFEVHDLDRTHNVGALTKKLEGLGYRITYKQELHHRTTLHHLLATAS